MALEETGSDEAGELFVIGGAEDKLGRRTVLREFVESAGGEDARIAVIPTASSLGPEIIDVYRAVFTKLGAADVVGVRPETREQAADPAYVDRLDDVTGVFMTGGNQLKLSSVVAGTAFGSAIIAAHRRGVTVGGTSAGASIQSSHMVAFGAGGATPKQRMTQVAAGLGLFENCVIDQHFEQRNRYGRLLMIVAQNPQLLGLGVDEDTAAVVRRTADSTTLRVVGRGAVTILDPADLVTNAYEAKRSQPILASGVKLHVLPAGAAFDLERRLLLTLPSPAEDGHADELALANADLRRLTRDIAAEDKSPAVFRRRLARRQKGTTR
ncbi:MAG: cyanophycinase [Propionibacteriales bacterium]|jgi:cyanophycinase|nr:cyanophycinase [Propionibacteriales bacterium]